MQSLWAGMPRHLPDMTPHTEVLPACLVAYTQPQAAAQRIRVVTGAASDLPIEKHKPGVPVVRLDELVSLGNFITIDTDRMGQSIV